MKFLKKDLFMNNFNQELIKNFFKSVFIVAIGAMSIKFSMFFINMVLVKNVNNPNAANISELISISFASASLMYLSSSRYIAREVIVEKNDALQLLNLAIKIIYILIPFLILFGCIFGKDAIYKILLSILFLITISKYDLFVNTTNALGLNKYAALGQALMALGIIFSAALMLLDFDNYYALVYFLLPFIAIVFSLMVYKKLRKKFNKNNIDKKNIFLRMRGLIYFSAPVALTGLLINPLVLWGVLKVSGLSSQNYILFVSALNFLGLAMLIPGQVNTVTFSILAKYKSNNINLAVMIVTFISAIISIIIVYNAIPLLGLVYGDNLNLIQSSIFWIVLCCIPFVFIQYFSSRLFLLGRPWLETISSMGFAITFILGCCCISFYNYGLYELSIFLFFSYIVKFLILLVIYLRLRKK